MVVVLPSIPRTSACRVFDARVILPYAILYLYAYARVKGGGGMPGNGASTSLSRAPGRRLDPGREARDDPSTTRRRGAEGRPTRTTTSMVKSNAEAEGASIVALLPRRCMYGTGTVRFIQVLCYCTSRVQYALALLRASVCGRGEGGGGGDISFASRDAPSVTVVCVPPQSFWWWTTTSPSPSSSSPPLWMSPRPSSSTSSSSSSSSPSRRRPVRSGGSFSSSIARSLARSVPGRRRDLLGLVSGRVEADEVNDSSC